ncbi:hypothetical protein TNCV_1840081 [Trichonephila clavipes]|nr:hypothetical protein TNCV_1840081 [Trichonephila clavipes]
MSSVGYSSSPVHWSRWSPSILAWSHSGKASLAAMRSQWRYIPKKSCPVVRCKWTTTSTLSRCLGIGPTVARVSPGFPKLFVFGVSGSIFVTVCGEDVLCASEGQGNFQLSQLGSPLGFWVGCFIAGDPNMTWDPLGPFSNMIM